MGGWWAAGLQALLGVQLQAHVQRAAARRGGARARRRWLVPDAHEARPLAEALDEQRLDGGGDRAGERRAIEAGHVVQREQRVVPERRRLRRGEELREGLGLSRDEEGAEGVSRSSGAGLRV